jgi:hypothetical protein
MRREGEGKVSKLQSFKVSKCKAHNELGLNLETLQL